jgi:ubiquitin-protein ligase
VGSGGARCPGRAGACPTLLAPQGSGPRLRGHPPRTTAATTAAATAAATAATAATTAATTTTTAATTTTTATTTTATTKGKNKPVKKGVKAITRQLKALKRSNKYRFTLPDNTNMFKITFTIEPRGMWTGIVHTFDVQLPNDFPYSAPSSVECNEYQHSLHPNIDPNTGTVCIDVLRSNWSPSMTLQDVCWTLSQLFAEPGWDHSINPDANQLFTHNKSQFFQTLKNMGATNPSKWADAVDFGTAETTTNTNTNTTKTNTNTKTKTDTKTSHACSETAALGCKHYVCDDCWTTYLTSRITSDGLGCIHAECPISKCHTIVTETFFSKYCSDSLFKRYERHVLSSYMSDSSFAKYCPSTGCNRIVEYPRGTKNRVIECICGHSFCFHCEREHGHVPLDCDMLEAWKEERTKFEGLSSTELWMAQNVKACPKKHGGCNRAINKNQGCMHMTCYVDKGGCGFEFCWLCLGPWSEHGSATGGYYACNNYDRMGKAGKLTGAARAAWDAAHTEEKQKELLAFYEFYVKRHVFMDTSSNDAKERNKEYLPALRSDIEKCLVADGQKVQDRHRKRSFIVVQANDMVAKCRRVLQWIYVAAYYFPRDDKLYPLFKNNHDSLEGHTEHLNRIVSFGRQLNGKEMSWGQIIEEGGSSVLADVLRELEEETARCDQFLNAFMNAEEYERYFQRPLRDVTTLPEGEKKLDE